MIVLSVAHHPAPGPGYDPGAVSLPGPDGSRMNEAQWSHAVVKRLALQLGSAYGIGCIVLDSPLLATIEALRKMPAGSVRLALELHLNAAPTESKGSVDYGLALISLKPTLVAQSFADHFKIELARWRRDVGSLNDRVDVWQCPSPQCNRTFGFIHRHPHPAVITESGFIDYPRFCARAGSPEGMDTLANVHAEAIAAALSKSAH